MISTPRIRCNYCSKRIPASAVVCPNCHRNPRAFYWKRAHVFLILGSAAIVLLAALFLFRNEIQRVLPASIALLPTATRTNTRPPITVIITATPRPATQTAVPPTATRGNTPTTTPTNTITPTQAATDTTTLATTPVPPPTETPTLLPTIEPVPAPQLVAPKNEERIIGANKRVFLQFQPAQPLRAQEWYRVQVDFLDRAGNPVSWCSFTLESAQEFPRAYFEDSSPNVRSFVWRVNVVRSEQFNPITCDAPFTTLSDTSQVWTFFWY